MDAVNSLNMGTERTVYDSCEWCSKVRTKCELFTAARMAAVYRVLLCGAAAAAAALLTTGL